MVFSLLRRLVQRAVKGATPQAQQALDLGDLAVWESGSYPEYFLFGVHV